MIKKVLIANRGEIAVRVIRTCKEMGLKTVSIYSEADRDCMHVKLADKSVCIGPAEASKSYLDIPRIMSAIEVSGADAVHPGYGFLAENPRFAEIVSASNKIFIGPPSHVLELIGDKIRSKEVAKKVGIPLVPGSDGCVDIKEAIDTANRIGYPVVIKASAGGGGRGIRVVRNEKELREKLPLAIEEAKVAFGDGRVYIEKYLINPKHIEVQVLADKYGHVISLGERECSIQRRNQKLIEEAPSISISEEQRKQIEEATIEFCRAIGYEGAGTVEFLMDQDGNFYFMEMNGRIQVEHPVTEMITGIDIVKWQIKIARGERLNIKSVERRGFAIEFRINAEDPNNFMPTPGKIEELYLPGGFGVRVDTHIYCGYAVPPYYDSLLAKLIVWGEDRKSVIRRAKRALEEFVISGQGLKTNIDFHRRVISTREFAEGKHHIKFIEEIMV
ncbi:MAG: acetyl-CoA carboxylase biotin carboxylase subunit [Hydrogenobacter thermophilus]|uniref:acetyl-CoA carboxylase biotin carboxylase subunit n=1 Tax=Hydrogenobacter thermophilus TaxID=940 RepID=UPI001C782DEC|nr:acetyl-CoA carboxylase biotin carboxylase subunit [Hydrogenobacter thermophilus]QWK19417.1 MAG: acetyl-CoA carboxylase biotin carboxylase subunit [Hydrogenobacter thermophilus]